MPERTPFRGLKNVTPNADLRDLLDEYREKDMDEAAGMLEEVMNE